MSEKTDEIMNAPVVAARPTNWKKIGILITMFALIIFVCTFGFGYFQLARVNMDLAKNVSALQQSVDTTQRDISNLQQYTNGLQQVEQNAKALSMQQAQMINDWKAAQQGDMNKWHVAEAQYLVNLANDQLLFTQNTSSALMLLQRASQVLGNLNDDRLMDSRKLIANDIMKLQSTPQLNVTQLYLFLSALNNQLDQLTLPATPLKNVNQTTAMDDEGNLSWWQIGLHRTWDTLKKIVIVQYNGKQTLPLVMPEEKVFLYQNLHAQMESAMWAALHRNADVYQQSLERAKNWIAQYFDVSAPTTQLAITRIAELQRINMSASTISLTETLQSLNRYLEQSSTTKS